MVNTFADYKIMINRKASNIVLFHHGNLLILTDWTFINYFVVLTALRFSYVVLYPNLMTVQRKGNYVFKELEQLKRSSAKCDAANKLPQNTRSGVKYCNFLRKKGKYWVTKIINQRHFRIRLSLRHWFYR